MSTARHEPERRSSGTCVARVERGSGDSPPRSACNTLTRAFVVVETGVDPVTSRLSVPHGRIRQCPHVPGSCRKSCSSGLCDTSRHEPRGGVRGTLAGFGRDAPSSH